MQAALKRLHSPDVDDLRNFRPDDPARFGFLLQAMFGAANAEGEDAFDLIVCSPAWLADRRGAAKILNGRHHLILQAYDFELLRGYLEDYAKGCRGETWEEVAAQLGRLGKWEFEDYQP